VPRPDIVRLNFTAPLSGQRLLADKRRSVYPLSAPLSFHPPFERFSDPQIPPTRLFFLAPSARQVVKMVRERGGKK